VSQHIGDIALLVADYDAAIDWYTRVAGFTLLEDTALGEAKRWVRVAPSGAREAALLLAQASTPEQHAAIGQQAGGRVWLFLHTDDFWADHRRMTAAGARFLESPLRKPTARWRCSKTSMAIAGI
jgi:catechol 2,3-dioxygenase-like lactoylglutathione lyase family enzyme